MAKKFFGKGWNKNKGPNEIVIILQRGAAYRLWKGRLFRRWRNKLVVVAHQSKTELLLHIMRN